MLNNFPSLSGILSDLWCMERTHLHRLIGDLCQSSDQRFGSAVGELASPKMEQTLISDGTAKIPIHGVIMKRVPAIFSFLGIEATGTEETGQAIKAALANEEVERIELDIDSPGGTISGVQQLADLIHAGKTEKPIDAKISDLAASAAYWLGSQASTIEANRGALVGSVGVYRVLLDSSGAAEQNGVKVHLISSGEFKGTGTPGAPITDAQLRDEQRIVDGAAAMFNAAIVRGRPNLALHQVERMATGSVWFADEAKEMGLVDQVTAETEPQKQEPVFDDGSQGGQVMDKPVANVETGSQTDPEKEQLKLEVAQLKQSVEFERTEKTAKDVALAAIIETQKVEVIERGVKEGRITPAMRGKVEDYAAYCADDLDKLKLFVDALPVQVRAQAQSEEPGVAQHDSMSDADNAVAKLLRINENDFKEFSEWKAISAGGQLLDTNGNVIGGLN